MRSLVYRLHIWLGLVVAIPVLAWASSGFLYAWPNAVEGGKVDTIDTTRVRVSPSEALLQASEFAGRKLPITALTLLTREGRPVYQAIGGMGAPANAAARCIDKIFLAGAFLFFCRKLADKVTGYTVSTSVHFSHLGAVFEFDVMVWETIQSKLNHAGIYR